MSSLASILSAEPDFLYWVLFEKDANIFGNSYAKHTREKVGDSINMRLKHFPGGV